MTEENKGESLKQSVVTLKSIISGDPSPAEAGLTPREDKRRRLENQVSGLKLSNEATDNLSKLFLIFLMMATVLIALSVSSYKYLNLGFFCRPALQLNKPAAGNTKNIGIAIPTADYVNCPFDSEQQKDAGALVQSIVSGIIGIVAGMGIGSRKQ
jgi:hypothetical protein